MQLSTYIHRLFSAYEEEEGSSSEIVQVLEYLSGGQLFEKIIESSRGKQRLIIRTMYQLHKASYLYLTIPLFLNVLNIVDIGENEIRQYIRQICAGCSYLATNNIVHLDLKPENIVCTDILDNGINRLKVSLLAQICSHNKMMKGKFCIILHGFKYFRLLILDLPNAYLMSQVNRL